VITDHQVSTGRIFSGLTLKEKPEDHSSHKSVLLFIPDPDFCPSPITDPKIATTERGEKKIIVLPFF
jgi:hypothetical protein